MAETSNQRVTIPILLGVLLALFGFALGRSLLSTGFFQVYKWVLAGVLVVLVVAIEGRPLTSIGVRRPEEWDIWIGVGTGVFGLVSLGVVTAVVGWFGFEVGFAENGDAEPTIVALFLSLGIGITAGITEEIAFRGYALERIESLTNSVWLAGGITSIIFIVGHYPSHDLGGLLAITPLTIVLTVAYVWRRNIFVPIIGHVFINGAGTVVAILRSILS